VLFRSAYKALVNCIKLQPGQKVLINGGSGGVGTYGVQIAKALGARVTATCGTDNIDFVKSLGADEVIDYKEQDARKLPELFDGVLDAAGKWDFSSVKKILTKNGVYVSTLPSRDVVVGMLASKIFPGKKAYIVSSGSGNRVSQELTAIADMITSGKVRTIIQETISLDEVPKAHEASQKGHARGKTIVRIGA
jgi:NADPH:quinone reductase-like Zn-dependent oxidoreductase